MAVPGSVNPHKRAFSHAITKLRQAYAPAMRWLVVLVAGCGFLPQAIQGQPSDAPDVTHDGTDAPPDAFATIGFMQATSNYTNNDTTLALPLTSAEHAGNLGVVGVLWNDPSASVASLVDDAGNAYTPVGPPLSAPPYMQQVYYAANLHGGPTTVTVTIDRTVGVLELRLLEYSGVKTTAPVDVVVGSSGQNSSHLDSGTVTTTHAHDLLVTANIVGNTTPPTMGAGFMQRVMLNGDACADKTVSAVGAYHAEGTLPSSDKWILQMIAFEAAD
jgi:hypothetical protein